MENIIEPTMDYDFSKLYLGPPSTLSGGAYFTRILHGSNKPLYMQTPKSLCKQGFVKSGKKIYIDLMFDNNDTIFINWIENLEAKCQELIYAKSSSWFETKLEKDDIESAFTSPFKIFKSGKYYLLRVNVKPNIRIEDEADQILQMDSINDKSTLISIIEIQGIKFTSRNFQIEMELRQAAVVSPDPFLDMCFIKKPIKKVREEQEQEQQVKGVTIEDFVKESVNDIMQNGNTIKEPLDSNTIQETETELELEEASVPVNQPESDNIVLDIEELNLVPESNEESLTELDLTNTLENNLETMTLKKPNQVYYEIYKKARDKAKQLKKEAILAYLESKNIKKTYMLEDIDESDSDGEFDGIDSDLEEDLE
jgi:hypothetical protein